MHIELGRQTAWIQLGRRQFWIERIPFSLKPIFDKHQGSLLVWWMGFHLVTDRT
jgi:hypothetical protein